MQKDVRTAIVRRDESEPAVLDPQFDRSAFRCREDFGRGIPAVSLASRRFGTQFALLFTVPLGAYQF